MSKVNVIKQIGNYTLLERLSDVDGSFLEYVVALNYNPETASWDSGWDSGDYFTPMDHSSELEKLKMYSRALDFFLYRVGLEEKSKGMLENKLQAQKQITYERLIELATAFKDGIFESDVEFAKEYIKHNLDLTKYEKEFFGLQEEYDVYEVEVARTIRTKLKIVVPKGEDEDIAIHEAEEAFAYIDLNQDERVEYEQLRSYPKILGTYDYDEVTENFDTDNDIDSL